jgi:hypothetical protein
MSFWSLWVWDAPHIAVAALETVAGWYAFRWARRGVSVDLWPGHDTTGTEPPANHRWAVYCHCAMCRRNRSQRREAGKPPPPLRPDAELNQLAPHTKGYRCTNCGSRCKKSIYHPGWDTGLDRRVSLCGRCFKQLPKDTRDNPYQWMGFDIVRTI